MSADLVSRLRARQVHDRVLWRLCEHDVCEQRCPGCGIVYPYPAYFTRGCCGYCGTVWELLPGEQ